MADPQFQSGFIAIVGCPNVGKSTLLNCLVGQKISITSSRPQTTRHRILGIKTTARAQLIYVDTPGIHAQREKAINQYMNRAASGSIDGVDCIIFVVTAKTWSKEDEFVLEMLKKQTSPVILAINKIDQLNDLGRLLPLLQSLHEKMKFAEIIPISAKTGSGVDDIEKMALRHLPAQTALFPEDQVTDRTERFMVAELIREQIFRNFGQELPYVSTVGIEQFQREQRLIRIEAVIWVEKPGQKVILIGENGIRLKEIGQRARLAMQKLLASKVYLGLWVKVRDGWSDDIKALRSLGYNED